MPRSAPRMIVSLFIAGGVAVASALGIAAAWTAIGGGGLTVHGWIALALGVSGTVGMAWGLMALAFKSNREGWDDRADQPFDRDAGPDKP